MPNLFEMFRNISNIGVNASITAKKIAAIFGNEERRKEQWDLLKF